MNVYEFFEQHSIEEINKKTKISPISLRFIKNKEFEKLPRVKFIGFIRLIEKEYKVDLSELIEEYNEYSNQKVTDKKQETTKEKKQKNYLWLLLLFLFVLSAYLYFKFIYQQNKTVNINNNVSFESNIIKNEINSSNETNNQLNVKNISSKPEINETKKNLLVREKNITKKYEITILPKQKVWFRAINLDTNESIEYLTILPKILKGNYYIKFGHGNITIIYNDQNITPNTKKIIRILFKNGKYKFLNKPNKYEK